MALANGRTENVAAILTNVEQRVHIIPVRARYAAWLVARGDSQVVISNSDLEDLIVSVLDAVDSPVDVRALRSLGRCRDFL